jgi:tRNA-dihydrouridine synthase
MLNILLEHIELYQKTWGDNKSYEPLKKFYKLYINGFAGASKVRAKLMGTNSIDQAKEYIYSLIESRPCKI